MVRKSGLYFKYKIQHKLKRCNQQMVRNSGSGVCGKTQRYVSWYEGSRNDTLFTMVPENVLYIQNLYFRLSARQTTP